jgi:hypothetical protein
VLTWWRRGGVNVVEVETGGWDIFKILSRGRSSRERFIFSSTICLPPRFSTTFFHHVKIGATALLLLLFLSFTFYKKRRKKIL